MNTCLSMEKWTKYIGLFCFAFCLLILTFQYICWNGVLSAIKEYQEIIAAVLSVFFTYSRYKQEKEEKKETYLINMYNCIVKMEEHLRDLYNIEHESVQQCQIHKQNITSIIKTDSTILRFYVDKFPGYKYRWNLYKALLYLEQDLGHARLDDKVILSIIDSFCSFVYIVENKNKHNYTFNIDD